MGQKQIILLWNSSLRVAQDNLSSMELSSYSLGETW